VAVEGCAHGELDLIYQSIQHSEKVNGIKVDLLICCGDFQAVRNEEDLQCVSVPPKYRDMMTFYKYYSGEKVAPVLTIFIGGNHEASNHLRELHYGGWVAPNIYFLGLSGVVNFRGLRIAGVSGIFKGFDYRLGYAERYPYHEKSVYHLRLFDIWKLKHLRPSSSTSSSAAAPSPVDIMVSHDWPRCVTAHGDVQQLLQVKPFFRQEVQENRLGSAPGEELLWHLRPRYWFAGHLHVKFAAVIPHAPPAPPTKFLALDKPLRNRDFLSILSIEPGGAVPVTTDSELRYIWSG
jgi:lariat debranching enzyme